MNTPTKLNHIWLCLRFSLDVLVAALLIVTLVRNPQLPTILWAAVFAVVYLVGSFGKIGSMRIGSMDNEVALTAARAPILVWLLVLLATWVGLALSALDAAYLAFPLFFVVLQITGGLLGFVITLALMIASICTIALHSQWTFGGFLGPLLGGVVAMTVGFGFRVIQRETLAKTQALAELEAARAESEALSRRAGELDERARLAADIHDTVAQGLSSIQLLLHSTESNLTLGSSPREHAISAKKALESLRLARQVAADNLTETRRIIAALQPAPLEGSDLASALRKVCANSPIADIVNFRVDGDSIPLDSSIEATLVRVAQGSLANVVKHSEATACHVTLTYQSDEVLLDIVDNGVGFDVAAPRRADSVGMTGAQRRVETLGGTFTVESSLGAGTGVSVSIPYRA